MEARLLAALILLIAAAPLALWARMAQSGRWIDLIVPASAALPSARRAELAPMISAGLWLHCALMLLLPLSLLLLSDALFKFVAIFVALGLPVLSATGAALLNRRMRAMKTPP